MRSNTPPHHRRDKINLCWIDPKVNGLDRIARVGVFIDCHGRQNTAVVGGGGEKVLN
jgi:hypothetical protein